MKKTLLILLIIPLSISASYNQTDDISPVIEGGLPFTITIETEDYTIADGIHSGATARCCSNVLYIAGRTNGLHGFDNGDNNFPPQQQNASVYVINLQEKTVHFRSLYDTFSGLTQAQIDTLSVTSPQSYQSGKTLYITGGYGVETDTGNFSTKDTLTAINVPGLIDWVLNPQSTTKASDYIRQMSNPLFQVTGGTMAQIPGHPTLLIFGQNFPGFYNALSNGIYTEQVRRFIILDDGKSLGVRILDATPSNPNYRRRDLNVIPVITLDGNKKRPALVALSGVFTLDGGIWTVPVEITPEGIPSMANPDLLSTFKQGTNNYACAHAELFAKDGTTYSLLFGGMTYEFYQNGEFSTDAEIPFTNQIIALKRSKQGNYTQHLLPTSYPTIVSTQSNPGNTLLFGAGAKFIRSPRIPAYSNGVLKLHKIKKPTVIGYIIGGIQSTLPNTNSRADSAASPYIFRVILTPH